MNQSPACRKVSRIRIKQSHEFRIAEKVSPAVAAKWRNAPSLMPEWNVAPSFQHHQPPVRDNPEIKVHPRLLERLHAAFRSGGYQALIPTYSQKGEME